MCFIDVHCHLTDEVFTDKDALLKAIGAAGVKTLISSGTDIKSSLECKALAEKYGGVYFTAGYHPEEISSFTDENLEGIASFLSHPKCVAVGEIGLDYHYDLDRQKQKDIFLLQLDLAYNAHMPVVIHSRDACSDTLDILKANKKLIKYGALMHCYSYSLEAAIEFEKLGCFFSFGGSSTYHGSKKAKRVIAALDEGRLLSETDSPYMPPKSRCGIFPNTSECIPEIVQNMAKIRGLGESEMAKIIWGNAQRLFGKLKS